MSNEQERWSYEDASEPGERPRFDVATPVGRPKPVPIQDLTMVPGKGNLGGPGNATANGGIGAEEPDMLQ